MKKKHTNLDSLLDQNAAEQLSTVDWDKLHSGIQKRLDHAQDVSRLHLRSHTMLKWAVGLSAAAAMVMAAYIFRHDGSNGIELLPGQRAAVKLTEPDTVAKVNVTESSGNRHVSVAIEPSAQKTQVSFGQSDRQIAQCSVTIIDQNGHTEKENNQRPSWVIMIASQAEDLENADEQEQAEIACLF
ncbi:MAG: hypothetical protein ACYTEU_12220 [Planctomycetota bacterium]|jgi:hypothetical protein